MNYYLFASFCGGIMVFSRVIHMACIWLFAVFQSGVSMIPKTTFLITRKPLQRTWLSSVIINNPDDTNVMERLRSAPNSKAFVSLLKRTARTASRLTDAEKADICGEIDLRFSQLDFFQLSECLWSMGTLKMKRDDVTMIQLRSDIIESLRSIKGKEGVSDKAMASILNGLVNTGGSKAWIDLPTDARELLLSRVASSVFEVSIEQRVYGLTPDVLWSLGKLSIELRTLKTDFRRSLMQAIVVATSSDNKEDGRNDGMAVGRLVYGLSQMGARWPGSSSLSDAAKRGLLDALAWHWGQGQMSEQTLVNTVYALGKMECPYLSLPTNTRRLLLTELQRTSNVMGPAAVANVLWALGRMKAKWSLLSESFRRSMLVRIVDVSPMGSHALTIAVTGLAKMGATWSDVDLDSATRTAMLDAAIQLCQGATEQQLSNLVYGLAKMGATWTVSTQPSQPATHNHDNDNGNDRTAIGEQLPEELRVQIMMAVETLAPKFTDLGLTNTIYGLAKMGCELKEPSLPRSALAALSVAVFGPMRGSGSGSSSGSGSGQGLRQSSRLSRMSDQSVSLLVWSFGVGGVKWTNGHADDVAATRSGSLSLSQQPSTAASVLVGSRECMEMAAVIERSVGRMSEQGVSNAMMGLCRMGVVWDDLPESTQLALLRALGSVGEMLTQQGLSHVLWAVAVMGVPVALSSTPTATTIASDGPGDTSMDEEGKVAARRASEALAGALQRLIGINHTSAPFSAQTLSSVLYALALASCTSSNPECGCAYADLDPVVRKALESACMRTADTMGAREVSLSFYGLGKLGASLSTMPESTARALRLAAMRNCAGSYMNEQNLGQLVWGLGRTYQGGLGREVSEADVVSDGGQDESRHRLGEVLVAAIEQQCARRALTHQSLVAVLQGLQGLFIAPDTGGDDDATGLGQSPGEGEGQLSTWSAIPRPLRSALMSAAMDVLNSSSNGGSSGSSELTGTLLYWFGVLNIPVNDFPESVKLALLAGLETAATRANAAQAPAR